MKKIFIRSPYFIEVDEVAQNSAKLELFFWNKGTTEPTTPNYTLSKTYRVHHKPNYIGIFQTMQKGLLNQLHP